MNAAAFWAKVDRRAPNECWPWTGATTGPGYGHCRFEGRIVGAHRVAFELVRGPIPAGLQLDHLCRNTICVNPAHLEPVTNRENTLRGSRVLDAQARHAGHDTIHIPRGTGGTRLICRTCRRARDAERKRAAA